MTATNGFGGGVGPRASSSVGHGFNAAEIRSGDDVRTLAPPSMLTVRFATRAVVVMGPILHPVPSMHIDMHQSHRRFSARSSIAVVRNSEFRFRRCCMRVAVRTMAPLPTAHLTGALF